MFGLIGDYYVVYIKKEGYILADEEAVDTEDLMESQSAQCSNKVAISQIRRVLEPV